MPGGKARELSLAQPHEPMTFDELILTFRCTESERDELAWFLAMFRARRTYEALRKGIGVGVLRSEITP